MQDLHTKTVREIALAMPITTRVFEEYKIDYCCHGHTNFEEACVSKGLDPKAVLDKIDGVVGQLGNQELDWLTTAALAEVIDYIVDKHHHYTREEMTHLTALANKVATRHGDHLPALLELRDTFQELCDELGPHMMKEEHVLFPYIEEMESRRDKNMPPAFPPFATVQNPVGMMMIEHESAGELLEKMRKLTDDYTLPEWACPSFTALYHRMAELEADLHQHIHLENNLLFPKAIEMEQGLLAAAA
ncbi:MAG: iron-sulfur cluster repair di-iron protein [Chloracidobacterium sp.]|nr:iron-sulfur cluster repair di-iron protein [Chloracidobacterium sp.]